MHQETSSGTSTAFYLNDYDPSLNGLGGWLAPIIFCQFATILIGIVLILDFIPYWGVSPELNLRLGLMFTIGGIVYILGSIVILYMIFSRKIMFRKLFVVQSVTSVAIYALLLIINRSKPDASLSWDFWRTLLCSVIGITYLYRSKRVRNTFIYPFAKSKTKQSV